MASTSQGTSAPKGRRTPVVRLVLLLLVLGAVGLLVSQLPNLSTRLNTGPNTANLPPAGVIWFGTSFDTTTFEVSGQADTFTQSSPLAMVAHFTRTIPGGQAVNILFDGVTIKSESASGSDYDVYGQTLNAAVIPTGSHTWTVQDLGGNTLASGTVTISP